MWATDGIFYTAEFLFTIVTISSAYSRIKYNKLITHLSLRPPIPTPKTPPPPHLRFTNFHSIISPPARNLISSNTSIAAIREHVGYSSNINFSKRCSQAIAIIIITKRVLDVDSVALLAGRGALMHSTISKQSGSCHRRECAAMVTALDCPPPLRLRLRPDMRHAL